MTTRLTDYQKGFLLGLLIGEGHFGGDSKQPHINLKMHVRHEPLMRWVHQMLPGGQWHGPYHHQGRHYNFLMFRGRYLREVVAPLLQSLPWGEIDPHSYGRFTAMLERYNMHATVSPEGSPWNDELVGERPQYRSLGEFLENTLPPKPRSDPADVDEEA